MMSINLIPKPVLRRMIDTVVKATSKTQEQLALDMGYGKTYFSEILAPTGVVTSKFTNSFTAKYGQYLENPNISRGKGSKALEDRKKSKSEPKKRSVPFYDAPAIAGISETDMTAIHAPAGTIDVGDLLMDSEAAIRIYGNSMMPNYPPGCVVGLVKCDSLSIEPGEVYVIETKTRRILKRLFYPNDKPNADKFICLSDNTMKFEGGARDGQLAYPAFEIPKNEIKRLYVVSGVIKRNANSIVINR
jgi:hypothetical protein